jgi:phage FluMu protein Com
MVIINDIKCPHCNKVIIPANNGIEFLETSNLKVDDITFPTAKDNITGIFTVDYPYKIK